MVHNSLAYSRKKNFEDVMWSCVICVIKCFSKFERCNVELCYLCFKIVSANLKDVGDVLFGFYGAFGLPFAY